MAPDPPPLRDPRLVGDEDHPALLDRRRGVRGDRLHGLPAVGHLASAPMRRPPLPPGPWLVVGLARSGSPRSRSLQRPRRGGARRRSPPGRRHARGARARPRGGQVARRARAGAGHRRRARARAAGAGRGRAGLAADPQRVHRGHRDQRQDDDDRAHRPHPPRGRAAGGGRRQRRHGAELARRHGCPTRPPWSARSPPSSSRTPSSSRPRAPCCSTWRPTTSTATAPSRPTSAAKLRVFAHQGNDDVAVAPLGLGVEDLGGCARRVCFGDGPQAELSDRAGQLWWADEPLHRRRGARRCAACTTAATRWRRRRSAWRAGSSPTPCARPCGPSPASSTASRRSRPSTASLYVNDSKATNVASTLVALESFEHADPPDPRRPGQGRGLRAAARARRRALRRRLPHRRGGRAPGARWSAASAAGRSSAPLDAAAAAARPGEVVLLSPACASLRPVRRLRGPRAGLQGVGGRAANLASICAPPPAPSRSHPSSTTSCSRPRCACWPWAR